MAVNFAIKSGSAAEPIGKDGLADFTYELLLEGTTKLDALALDKAFGVLGTSAQVATSDDGAVFALEALTRNADPALALLADVLQKPRFAKEDFERNKKRQLSRLAAQLGNPGFLAAQAYGAIVFGEKHPYGHTGSGLPKTVSTFTLDDAKGFYKKSVGPQAGALIVVGDTNLAQVKGWAEKYFGKWKSTAKVPPVPKPVEAKARAEVVLVPKEGLNQTVVVMGRPAIPTGHPDEAALELATSVFGGFFGSRLNMNLREDKGYSYGANASLDTRRGVGPLTARSSVRADATGPAVAEFVKELQGVKARPITAQELDAAREGLIRAFPGYFESLGAIAGSAASLYFEDQPLDRYQKLIAQLESAKLADVQKVAEKYFDPARMQLLLVGDPTLIQAQVDPLELGKMVVHEIPGAPQ